MRRFFLWSIALVLIGVPAALIAAAWLALDDRPAVVRKVELTPEQIARARALARAHDPRQSAGGGLRSMTLSAQDVDVAANYFLAGRGGGAKGALQPGAAMLWAAVPVPPNPFGTLASPGIPSHFAEAPDAIIKVSVEIVCPDSV